MMTGLMKVPMLGLKMIALMNLKLKMKSTLITMMKMTVLMTALTKNQLKENHGNPIAIAKVMMMNLVMMNLVMMNLVMNSKITKMPFKMLLKLLLMKAHPMNSTMPLPPTPMTHPVKTKPSKKSTLPKKLETTLKTTPKN